MSRRVDIHRKGAFVPEHYELVLTYHLETTEENWPIPSFGINCELDRRRTEPDGTNASGAHDPDGRCCVVALRNIARVPFAAHGGTGQCTICGARFIHGAVWRHVETNEHVHVGHQCEENMELVIDDGVYDATAYAKHKSKAIGARVKAMHDAEREAFLGDHPGLFEALEQAPKNETLYDLLCKFTEYRYLTDAQVALALRIGGELNGTIPPEPTVKAPTGRVPIRGVVVGAKQRNQYDPASDWCMTVKVVTPEGYWLATGTIPLALVKDVHHRDQPKHLRGREVEFSGDVTPWAKDESGKRGYYKRPTKARFVDHEKVDDALQK